MKKIAVIRIYTKTRNLVYKPHCSGCNDTFSIKPATAQVKTIIYLQLFKVGKIRTW